MQSSRKKTTVDIGVTYTNNQVYWPFAKSLFETDRRGLELRLLEGDSADLAEKRNQLVKLFLEGRSEFLLFIDSDMSWESTAIKRLAKWDLPLIGAVCYHKQWPHSPVIFDKKLHLIQTKVKYPKDRPFEVDVTGAAFLMIRRDVFARITYPWFDWQRMAGAHIGEDIYFMDRARMEEGYHIYVDPTIKIGHLGHFEATREDWEKNEAQFVLKKV